MGAVYATDENERARGNLGFEAKLWAMAGELRGGMDSGEYKRVVLGLIFLKYISDRYEQLRVQLVRDVAGPSNERIYIAEPDEWDDSVEDGDVDTTRNVFLVAAEARWSKLRVI